MGFRSSPPLPETAPPERLHFAHATERLHTAPLLLNAERAARFVGVSERTWRQWDAEGRVPEPIRLGRSRFWSRFELAEWVQRRCPPRA